MKRIHIAIIINIIICIILYIFSVSDGKILYVTKINREKVTQLLRDSKVRIEDYMIIKKVKTEKGRGEIFVYIDCENGEKIESYINGSKDVFSPYIKLHGISRNLLYTISKITLIILIILAIKDKFQSAGIKKDKNLSEEDKKVLKDAERQ